MGIPAKRSGSADRLRHQIDKEFLKAIVVDRKKDVNQSRRRWRPQIKLPRVDKDSAIFQAHRASTCIGEKLPIFWTEHRITVTRTRRGANVYVHPVPIS